MSGFPVRCFTCGKVIDQFFEDYQQRLKDGESAYDILDDLKIGRVCCRRMFVTHVDIDRFAEMYPTYPDRIQHIGVKYDQKNDAEEEEEEQEGVDDGENDDAGVSIAFLSSGR